MRFIPGMFLLLPLLAGCTVGPVYQPPRATLPTAWTAATQPAGQARAVDLPTWWLAFEDPALTALIAQARAANLDLRLAFARLQQARAQYGVTAADAYPTVTANGGITHQRRSMHGLTAAPGSGAETNLYQAGFDASWELDFFGYVKHNVTAAGLDVQAAQASWDDALLTLTAEVARNYLELRSAQNRLAIAQHNIAAQADALALAQTRVQAGLSSDLDVAQAQALLSATRAQVPVFETQIQQTLHALDVLLGREPGAVSKELAAAPAAAVHGGGSRILPLGLPAELLARRPDVRRAERQLAAATARVGVATADLYPHFMLTGSIGLQSLQAGDFFEGPSRFYTLGPSVRWPILDFQRLRARVKVQDALTQQALATWEKTWRTALAEVENALVAYYQEQARGTELRAALVAQQRALNLSEDLYRQGLVTYLNVIDAQRQVYGSEDALAQSDNAVAQNLVALCKALGGGWQTDMIPPARRPGR